MTVDTWKPQCTNDEALHAHGGQILKENGNWYFIGEDRRGNSRISIYRSSDFSTWERVYTLKTDNTETDPSYPERDLELVNSNLERPKLIYCKKTCRYVMWMHYESKDDYALARTAVAWADSIEGPYHYTGSFRPLGFMSRDLNVFLDEDGVGYMISASDDNSTLRLYRLTDDMMHIDCLVTPLFKDEYREAPVIFKKDGLYYLLTSGCTGWAPNQGKYSTSLDLMNWKDLKNFGDDTTYFSQPTSVFEREGELFYLGDRWGGRDAYHKSSYVTMRIKAHEEDLTLEA